MSSPAFVTALSSKLEKAISIDKLPKNTPFIELPEDWDHFELPYTKAMELLEPLKNIGISKEQPIPIM